MDATLHLDPKRQAHREFTEVVTWLHSHHYRHTFRELSFSISTPCPIVSGVAESYVAKNPELYKIVYQDMTEGEQFAIAMGLNDTDEIVVLAAVHGGHS